MSFGIIMCKPNMVKNQNCLQFIYSFNVYIKTSDIYKDIAEDTETTLQIMS